MGLLDKMRSGMPAASGGSETDPVCGMKVDPARAAGTSAHGAQTFYFCSPGCKQKFDADPHRYLGAHSH
jgi:Cu+-exporting ATPase